MALPAASEPLARFHPLVRDWFVARFASPTDVQQRGWAAIRAGRSALLSAPTGSGKTLAAFLVCIDDLVRRAADGALGEGSDVVYVSPLKALSNDIRKNLEEPLAGIRALAAARGIELPPITVGVRTGDTRPAERLQHAKRPPHVWVTTPESLFILLGSESGRKGLARARTLVLDEIHAVADDKRGAHLALSAERLDALAGRPLQRIGLSATVSPIQEIARLLVGSPRVDRASGEADCAIVEPRGPRPLDLALELPKGELSAIATHEAWRDVLDRIAELAGSERTTLVFVNTRRLAERVSHALSERIGEEHVAAHHGSLARGTRLRAEERLKRGDLRICVATASLELGIDIGSVDLVVQIGSPRSVSVFLQRAGRSGHAVGRTPRARLFPLTRDELLESLALVRLARAGVLDRLQVPAWPLDALAQQIVAAAAAGEWDEAELYATVQRAWPYRDLPRARFDAVVAMLADGFSPRLGKRGGALLHRDGVNGKLRARRGARLTALTNAGTIPDLGDYDVVAEPEGTLVGKINEDFAIESLAGDVFLLGNASWRIRRVESGRVRVEDAQGATPTIPFWLGEAPGRTPELSREVGRLRDGIGERLPDRAAAAAWVATETGAGEAAADAAAAFVEEGVRVLGLVPTADRFVAERFFDESGGMQLVIHAPLGARINRAWGMALRKRFCRSFDFELQAAATDEGINLSLGPQHSFPLADVFQFVGARQARNVLEQAVLQSPLFGTRWRWAASRALALVRYRDGRKVPAPLQRMRSDDLLAAVFPAQAACQDNAPGGDIELPDHPLVFEAMRDCLEEALDLAGLEDALRAVERGTVAIHARDTVQPSVFSHGILNAMPYAFLDDAPLEERRARAVTLRRALPEDQRDLGRLDAAAIEACAADAWPAPRDADELHETLSAFVIFPTGALGELGDTATAHLDALDAAGRIARVGSFLAVTERAALARRAAAGDEDATRETLRGWSQSLGPFTTAELARRLDLSQGALDIAAAALEGEGALLRGSFRAGVAGVAGAAAKPQEEWCDRRILARIHRATIARLRREIEPVSVAAFLRFLAGWQRVAPGTQGEGVAGLYEAIECLQGFEAAASAWETALLPARVAGYERALLDRLCLGGDVVWGRLSVDAVAAPDGDPRTAPLTRQARVTFALREDLPWLLAPLAAGARHALGETATTLRDELAARGALFPQELASRLGLPGDAVDAALEELVAAGVATADGLAALRRIAGGMPAKRRRARAAARFERRRGRVEAGEGRFWLLPRPEAAPPDAVARIAAQLLRRYGVLFRDLLAREAGAPPWRELLPVLRRAEARGEIRGGRFVAGPAGEQFALAEAVDGLRAARRGDAGVEESSLELSACDPLNLAGILTPGARVPALAGATIRLGAAADATASAAH